MVCFNMHVFTEPAGKKRIKVDAHNSDENVDRDLFDHKSDALTTTLPSHQP